MHIAPTEIASKPRPMSALAVELSYACNQCCAYCYNPGRARDPGAMALTVAGEPTTELLLGRLRRLLSAWEISMVTLTGGEPLRHAALFPLLEELRRTGPRAQLITNGTLVTREMASRLASYPLAAVQINRSA